VGQFWTPISAKGGSLLHADLHPISIKWLIEAVNEGLKCSKDNKLDRELRLAKLCMDDSVRKDPGLPMESQA